MSEAEGLKVLAILTADIHLDHVKPPARHGEEDWWKAMERPIRELGKLSDKYLCPVIVAGDLFHKPNPPPELINWAIKYMPYVYAVPGQHDLPYHRYEDIRKSAYWTMVEVCKIINLKPEEPLTIPGVVPLNLWGFPFGHKIHALENPHDLGLEIAVVHDYFWSGHSCYDEASTLANVFANRSKMKGWDIVVCGDNHIPFETEFRESKTLLFNCGTFMRRRANEWSHNPSVGLLMEDGSVVRHYLDISKEKFSKTEEKSIDFKGLDISKLMDEVDKLTDGAIDFADRVRRILRDGRIRESVEGVILAAMEGWNGGEK